MLIFRIICHTGGNGFSQPDFRLILAGKSYKVSLNNKDSSRGTAEVSKTEAHEGEEVTVTARPVSAYTSGDKFRYTAAKSVTVKKAKVSLKKGSTYKIKADVIKLDKSKKLMPIYSASKLCYLSNNKNVAAVFSLLCQQAHVWLNYNQTL